MKATREMKNGLQRASAGAVALAALLVPTATSQSAPLPLVGTNDDAASYGVEGAPVEADFLLGQGLAGTIGAGELDTFTFYAVSGTKLSFTVRASGAGNELSPLFFVNGPQAVPVITEVDSLTSNSSVAKAKKVVTLSTGLHRITIRGAAGSTGTYTVKTRGKLPKMTSPALMIDGTAVTSFDAVPGMTLRKLSVKALSPKGKFATLWTAPVTPGIVSLDACGTPLDISQSITTSKSGRKVTLKDVEITEACQHELQLEQAGSNPGFARIKTKLRMPKGKGVVTDEPAPEPE